METKTVTNRLDWDQWLIENSECHQFAQSWVWGEILLADGRPVERLAVVDSEKVIAQAQVVYQQMPFGWKYAFSPNGGTSHLAITDYLKNKGCIFYRLEPRKKLITNCPIIKTIDINPRTTVRLDLSESLDKLLDKMKSKTRYNIRLAEQKRLSINDDKNPDGFYRLSRQTAKRDGFSLHPMKHYHHVIAASISYQLSAFFENKIIASNVFVAFGDTFTYLYGALDYRYRSLMAPYLLQWHGIKLAKAKGYRFYDLFGIAPLNQKLTVARFGSGQAPFCLADKIAIDKYTYDQKHQYTGVTKFKLGFGGTICQHPGTIDLVFNKSKYGIYCGMRRVRRLFK